VRAAALLLASVAVAALAVGAGSAGGAGGPARAAAKRTNILCLNGAGTRYVVRYRPRSCAHFGPGGTFGGGVNLRRIHWNSWSRPSVTGRARECGFHLPCENTRVRLRAYRRRHACGRIVYTRLKARSRFGITVVRLKGCPGAA
jgi:hypothetical protein